MITMKQWLKKIFGSLVFRKQLNSKRRAELDSFLSNIQHGALRKLSDSSFDVFTYHGEDGIIGYLIRKANVENKTFVDIGSGDCIKSNCACLAVHYNWQGLFIDSNQIQLNIGRKFYRNNNKVRFKNVDVSPENVNEILKFAGITGKIGLVSIDIDGNDYWIWKALNVIQPEIVVIEAKIEYGTQDLIVPYGGNNHRSKNIQYNGASVKAFEKLGLKKGYKLVGSNKEGYNLFFVKENLPIPAITADELLHDPYIQQSFFPLGFFKQHEFVTE